MKKIQRNLLIIISAIILLLIFGIYLDFKSETYTFDEFSIEAPSGIRFIQIPSNDDPTIKEMYRNLEKI